MQRLAADRRRQARRGGIEIERQLTGPGMGGDDDDTVAKGLENAHEFVELVEADRLEMDLIVVAEGDPVLPHNWEEPEGIQSPNRAFKAGLGHDERCETFGHDGLCLGNRSVVGVLLWSAAYLVFHWNPALSYD